MPDQQSPEELLKQQKANCIFCKIIAGEIPSRKVYEDDLMAAVLDINPATKGHVLVMTKEHYPIMPLIPPATFDHLFGKTAALAGAVRAATIAQSCTTFIANGAVAGQQSPHFLFHLIPREQGDGLTSLTIPKRGINQSDIEQMLQQNLYAVMRQHLTRSGKLSMLQVGQPVKDQPTSLVQASTAANNQPPQASTPAMTPLRTEPLQPPPSMAPIGPTQPRPSSAPNGVRPTFEQLAAIIEQNPELKALLVNNPEKLQAILAQNPELASLFTGVDIPALGARLRSTMFPDAAPVPSKQRSPPLQTQDGQDDYELPPLPERPARTDEVKPAARMTMEELFAYIESKPRLKEYLLSAPNELKLLIPDNARLSAFFAGSNIDGIINAYQEHLLTEKKKEEGVEQPAEKRATQMTMQELMDFVDAKPKLRELILYSPEELKQKIPQNARLKWFFEGSNVNAVIQAYQEYAKEKQGVRITVEPEEAQKGEVRIPLEPSRQEEGEAYEEMRDGTHKGRMNR